MNILQRCSGVLPSLLRLNPVAQQNQTFHISVSPKPAPAALTGTVTSCFYYIFMSNCKVEGLLQASVLIRVLFTLTAIYTVINVDAK